MDIETLESEAIGHSPIASPTAIAPAADVRSSMILRYLQRRPAPHRGERTLASTETEHEPGGKERLH